MRKCKILVYVLRQCCIKLNDRKISQQQQLYQRVRTNVMLPYYKRAFTTSTVCHFNPLYRSINVPFSLYFCVHVHNRHVACLRIQYFFNENTIKVIKAPFFLVNLHIKLCMQLKIICIYCI